MSNSLQTTYPAEVISSAALNAWLAPSRVGASLCHRMLSLTAVLWVSPARWLANLMQTSKCCKSCASCPTDCGDRSSSIVSDPEYRDKREVAGLVGFLIID
eukprot:1385969-Amorphochlora_amoeboformis.AAC.2